ncbi:MAG: phage tail protein I [Robiginitomaculum sp.]|nr:phage tail protein I [Robiginitomaculum sp.]
MLKTILPSTSSDLEKALDINSAARFDHDLPIDKLWSAETCPVQLLPFLAWALSVDTWNSDWPEHIKRKVIATSAYVHRYKGTAAGIRAALDALELGVEISEWFEHGGDPYTFTADVMVSTRGLTASEIEDIKSTIAYTKNARSHLERLRIYLAAYAKKYIGVAMKVGRVITLYPYVAELPALTAQTFAGGSMTITRKITIGAPNG